MTTQAALLIAVALLVVTALAAAVDKASRWVSDHRGKKLVWWSASDTGVAVDLRSVSLTVASTRRSSAAKTPTVVCVRAPNPNETGSQWLFGANAKDEPSVHQIAASAGLRVGERLTDDDLRPVWEATRRRRWWEAVVEDEHNDDPQLIDFRAPTRANPPAELSDLLADVIERSVSDNQNIFVVAWRASAAPDSVDAACWTTSERLAGTWAVHASEQGGSRFSAHHAKPDVAALAARSVGVLLGVAGGVSGVLLSAGVTFASVVLVAAGLFTAAFNGLAAAARVRLPATIERLIHDHVTLPQQRGVAAWKVAEWVSAGSAAAISANDRLPADVVTRQPDTGVRLGVDAANRECWLSDNDRQWGIITFGDPGTGKTTFTLNVLRGDCRAVRESDAQRWIVWIETKGEGAQRAKQVMNASGVEPVVISLSANTPGSLRLEVVDRSQPERAGRLLAEAMQYAFPTGDIHTRTREVLSAALTAATSTSADVARFVGLQHPVNIVEVAYLLLGGDTITDEARRRREHLFQMLPADHIRPLSRYFGDRSKVRQTGQILESPLNKLSGLLPAKGLFDAAERPWTTWDQILRHNVPTTVLIDASIRSTSESMASAYTEKTAQHAAALTMYALWDSVQRVCDGWQAANRSVAVYSDELRDIAGFGGAELEVVRALADQGRSRGVMPVFATQRPQQLTDATREAVLSFGTRGYFRLESMQEANAAAADLDHAYTHSEVRALTPGRCAIRMRRDGRTQPAFTLCPDDL